MLKGKGNRNNYKWILGKKKNLMFGYMVIFWEVGWSRNFSTAHPRFQNHKKIVFSFNLIEDESEILVRNESCLKFKSIHKKKKIFFTKQF